MSTESARFSRLAPLPIEEKIRLAFLALKFFAPMSYAEVCEVLGKTREKGRIVPMESSDFLLYLEKTGELPEAQRYMHRIRELLAQLAAGHVLSDMGQGRNVMAGPYYYFQRELTERERQGIWWLAPALGPEFVYYLLNTMTFQITGRNRSDDVVAGTGLAVSSEWLLTCAHVLTDMSIDKIQIFHGVQYSVLESLAHPSIDVGLLRLEPALPRVPGLAFCNPLVGSTVYTLGYPRIPLSKEPSLIIHRGEVTSAEVSIFSGQRLFLYSAIARPGNSGGPIVGDGGNIVGVVSDELSDTTTGSGLPFYAGVRASDIASAVRDLAPSLVLPIEDYS